MTETKSSYEQWKRDFYASPLQIEILKTLEEKGELTRRDFVKLLEIPRTTIYDNLVRLQKQKIIEKFSRSNGKAGRPLIYWKLTYKGKGIRNNE
ncbi:MAG: winged helix-turn-helix domain-containing protein [Candidatus Odinarchaeota archaeon]